MAEPGALGHGSVELPSPDAQLLAERTTLRLGGPVRALVTPPTTEDLRAEVAALDACGASLLVLGGGSNLVVGDGGDPEVFTFDAPPRVVLGAAMLVWRIYDRRRTPSGLLGSSDDGYAGVVKEDPDIARFLGVGSAGKFVFGGYTPPPVEVV